MEQDPHGSKWKKLHLDVAESVRLSQSEDGSASLRQPFDRTRPEASCDYAMAPRYGRRNNRFRLPRRAASPNPEEESRSEAEEFSSINVNLLNYSPEDEMDELLVRHKKRFGTVGSERGRRGRKPSVLTSAARTTSFPGPSSAGNVSKAMQGRAGNTDDPPDWGDEEEDKEMAEKSSDGAIDLICALGGFRTAGSLQQGPSSSSVITQKNSPFETSPRKGGDRNAGAAKISRGGRKQNWVRDSNQSSITSFMCKMPSSSSSSSTCSSNAGTSNNNRTGFVPQISSPSQVYSPVKNVVDRGSSKCDGLWASEKITYGSPSKMYSPLKKKLDSETVYVISDDSSCDFVKDEVPCSSSVSSSQTNPAVKNLFASCVTKTSLSQTSHKPKGNTSKRKMLRTSTASSDKRSKRKKPKQATDPCQRTLGCVSSILNLCDLDFDDADDEDFACVVSAHVSTVKTNVKVGPTFGLLNDSEVERVEVNWFEHLPPDIVENIFCSLPMIDLCLCVTRVCLGWSSIVSNPTFMPWKKLYHKLKKGDEDSRTHVQSILRQENFNADGGERLLKLMRFMATFKMVARHNNACAMLRSHPKYTLALTLMEEKAPQCFKGKEPNPWSLMCALVLVSATVEDVHCALRLLTSPRSQLLCAEVLECFYCINTFLLQWKCTAHQLSALREREEAGTERRGARQVVDLAENRSSTVLRGMHYRLFYALYLYENSFVSRHAMLQQAMVPVQGQQSIVKYSHGETEVRLTHEQLRIINYTPDMTSGEIVKVFAFAGTGKTTVLLKYTQMRPHLKFLLIVFNKSVCTHAQSRFPRNVTCKTGHGLAFGVTGRRFAAQKNLNGGNFRVYEVAMGLRERGRKGENLFVRAKFVMDTLKSFLSSSDEMITSRHVPEFHVNDANQREFLEHSQKMAYAEDATHYWSRMKDPNDLEVKMTHDGYLKLYQLWKPTLSGYDVILVDEAQDLCPALLDVIERQHQPKVFVGDRHQQIYAFRGAVNAMQGLTAHKVFYLTQSFRFGPEVAQVANTLLECLKNETVQNIVGHGMPGSVSGDQVGQLAVLCRTNYSVFSEAVKVCSSAEPSVRIAFVGGLESLGLLMLKDIYTLMLSETDRKKENLQIANKFIARFSNLGELEKYARKTSDLELSGKVRLVLVYRHNLPPSVAKIEARAISNIQQADIVFSTAHKAKGLEFSTVKVVDDFLDPESLGMHMARDQQIQARNVVGEEDVNVLYVAVTRAKQALVMSQSLRTMLVHMGGGCYHPALTDRLKAEGVPMTCLVDRNPFQPGAITLYRPKVTLGNHQTKEAGVLSPAMLQWAFADYAYLLAGGEEEGWDPGHVDALL